MRNVYILLPVLRNRLPFSFTDPSDQDIITIFNTYKSNIKQATAKKTKGKTTDDSTLQKAWDDAMRRQDTFDRDKKKLKNNEEWLQSKSYKDSVNAFRNFINTHGTNLNKIFKDRSITPVSRSCDAF